MSFNPKGRNWVRKLEYWLALSPCRWQQLYKHFDWQENDIIFIWDKCCCLLEYKSFPLLISINQIKIFEAWVCLYEDLTLDILKLGLWYLVSPVMTTSASSSEPIFGTRILVFVSASILETPHQETVFMPITDQLRHAFPMLVLKLNID